MRIFLSNPITHLKHSSKSVEWQDYCDEVALLLAVLRDLADKGVFCALEVEAGAR